MSMHEHEVEQQRQHGMASAPACVFCSHWDPTRGRHCAAFPSTLIPTHIWDGLSFHLAPVGGEQRDLGGQPMIFELHPKTTPAMIEASNPALAEALRHRLTR